MDSKKVIAQLMSVKNNNVVKNVKVRNINVTEMENYDRVAMTLQENVKGYVVDEDGVTYKEGEVKTIFISNYSIIANLRENDDVAFIGNWLVEHKKALNVVLSDATVDIIQEVVTQGQEYTNPFSDNPTPTIVQHDNYYNHVVNIRLGKRGLASVEKIADKMLFGDDM